MTETNTNGDRLDSWKEIAAYLKRNERTVSRWEKRGLPVYRVPGGERQTVFAYKHELDEWLRRGKAQKSIEAIEPPRSNDENARSLLSHGEEKKQVAVRATRRPRVKYALIATSLGAVAILASWLVVSRRARADVLPVRVDFSASAITVFDDKNNAMWTHRFERPLDFNAYHKDVLARLTRIVDLEGKGETSILVTIPLHISPNPGDDYVVELDCFSREGNLLWSYIPQNTFRFGSYELRGPWSLFDVFVSPKGPPHTVWVAYGHREWGNSFVVQLDPRTGKDTLRFVNTGDLYMLKEVTTSNGSYLLAGGFNNEYAAGSLAVVDEGKSFAASPQTEGTRHKCMSCPEGAPDYYFVFPRSEINRLFNIWEDSVRGIKVDGEEVEVSKSELNRGGLETQSSVYAIYFFQTKPTIQPFTFRFDSEYDLLHEKFTKEKKLDHPLASCPERLHPEPVRMWTPAAGWTEVKLNPTRAVD